MSPKPVLLATDGSPSAAAATAEAIELAHAVGAPLIVTCVAHVAPPPYGAYYGYGEVVAELRKAEDERVGEVLAATRQQAEETGVACETVALTGLPGKEICELARERNPRLVVVGAHGFGRVGRILHGSISTHVLHHAPCPVLVVHGDETAGEDELGAKATALA
ncbi:MAG TPA: universal stress protein [Gaiellaceae bacterium]